MNIDTLSPEQLQKAFKLCDIMSLEDLFVAATILQNYGWNVEKAIDEIAYTKQQENKPKAQPYQPSNLINPPHPYQNYNNSQQNFQYNNFDDQDPYHINDANQNEDMVDYQDYEYQYAQNELQRKRKMFEQNYASDIPLNKTISQPHYMLKQLQKDKILANDYHFHRHYYQTNLLKRSQQICNRILQSKNSPNNSKHLYQVNNKKITLNKKFIVYLHKIYKSKINFTFGTFMLNLIRSHLDDKYLLVFILHENNHNMPSKVVQKILTQPEIAKFVNNNSISYGMFDNSDDYEIVQKYVPLKDLPAFAIFKYNKKEQKQTFLSSYPLLNNQQQNVIEWMAKWMGIPLKKKQAVKKSQQKIITKNQIQYQKLSNILQDQNQQYQEMQKLYKMKRLQSRLNKQTIKQKQNHLIELKNYFDQHPEPELIPGQSIQIKFRMPISGESKIRVFRTEQKIQIMFDYIEAFFQSEFEEPFCQFDLSQTFPTLSLKDKKQNLIKEIFQNSDRQNIIVKEV